MTEVLELLETNRVVTLHGLGGVGKSAVARHLARRQQDRGHNVVTARLDGLAGSDEVCLSVAAALGLPGAATPPDLAAVAAGRGVGAATTLVLDGAEAAAPAVAELADALAATAPGLTVLVTSRVPMRPTARCRCCSNRSGSAPWTARRRRWSSSSLDPGSRPSSSRPTSSTR